jgi:signal transduction histidine kinase
MSGSNAAAPLQLEALALVVLLVTALARVRLSRRQAARLAAVDFVRATVAAPLAGGEALEDVLPQVVRALGHALALDAAEVWQASGDELLLTASDPSRQAVVLPLPLVEHVLAARSVAGMAWVRAWLPELVQDGRHTNMRVAPMVHGDRVIGLVAIARMRGGWRLGAEADMTLEELAREVGEAIHMCTLEAARQESLRLLRQQMDDLSASRARIVVAADAERRRVERDLHDGAQQYLVALGVKVRLLQRMLERDPRAAQEISEELADDVERSIDALRNLARGIHPMLLSRGGLAPALAEAFRRAGVAVRPQIGGLRRHSAEVEAAVYFCCVEALQNVARHAGPHAVATVRAWEENETLRFEVVDDGFGFAAGDAQRGAGLTNMSDRLGALGGLLEVDSAPGSGTRIRGQVPADGFGTGGERATAQAV